MVRWYCRLNGHEVEQTQGDSEGQGRLACYSSWGCKEMDATQQLKNNIVTVSGMLQPVIYEKPFLVLDGGSDMVPSHLLCFSSLGYETHFVFALLWQLCCSLSLFSHSLEEKKKNHGKEMSLNRTAAKSTILVKIIQLCSHIVRHLERSLKKIIRVKPLDVWACMNANAACFFANL